MAPPKWATTEQEAFLKNEDKKWEIVKAGTGTLKGFYTRTANAFLEKWPAEPDAKVLKLAKGNEALAKTMAETQARNARTTRLTQFLFRLTFHNSASRTGSVTSTAR